MVQILSNFSAALRYLYDSDIVPQLNDNNLAKRLRKKYAKDLDIGGLGAVIPIDGSRNRAVMSTGESGTMATAGRHTPKQLIVPFKDVKARFGLSLETIKATETNKQAAANALEYEKRRLIDDIEWNRNRIFWGYGSGILGVSASGTSSANQTVKDPMNVLNAQSSTSNPARFIQEDMVIALQTAGVINAIGTVSSVNQSTGTVTFSGSVTTTTGDLFVLGTSATSNNSAYNKEPMGLLGLVDASTYLSTLFSFDRTAAGQTFFQSGVATSVGAISEDFLLRKIHEQNNVSGKKINQFFGGDDVLREYIKLSQSDRRYNSDGKVISPDVGVGGAGLNEELLFCGIPIAVDKHAPYGHLFGVNTEHLFFVTLEDGAWEEYAGGPGNMFRVAADKTDYEAVWYSFYNMVCDKGNANFRLSGITSTVTAGSGVAA